MIDGSNVTRSLPFSMTLKTASAISKGFSFPQTVIYSGKKDSLHFKNGSFKSFTKSIFEELANQNHNQKWFECKPAT